MASKIFQKLIHSLNNYAVLFVFFSSTICAIAQVKMNNIENPAHYFSERIQVMHHAKSENWQELIPIAERLIEQYQMDGDLFYILGLSYYETKHYQKAIAAFEKTLDLGGTILHIPSGSPPLNDIMIKIAKAYALNGDKENAILWLQKGFAARYDEKPFLKGDPAFNAFNSDEDFLQLFGIENQSDLSREEAWANDLNYLKRRILEAHYSLTELIPEKDFNALFTTLKSNLNTLSDAQITVEIMKIMGKLGSGHNFIIPTTPNNGALKKLPIQLYQFNDGMFIVDAEADFEKWIGYKVDKIGATPIEEALQKTNEVNARDNEMQTLWLGPYFLSMPDVLMGLGIIEKNDEVNLTLQHSSGEIYNLILKPNDWNFTGFPTLPPLKKESQPLYLSKKNDLFWYEPIGNQTLYIQFNSVQNKDDQTLEAFTLELQQKIGALNISSLVLDLRHNAGGNGAIRNHMLKLLVHFEAKNPDGKIFVLMGRNTYSAAQNLLTEIATQTKSILVGEPSSSKPSFIGEASWFQLPNSGLLGIVSSQYFKNSEAEDFRKWIAPHLPVSLSSKDYFNGEDKALKTVIEVIGEYK